MSRMPTEIAIGSEWNETPPPDQWDGSQPFYLIELLVSKNATKCNDIYTTAPGKLYANVCVRLTVKRSEMKLKAISYWIWNRLSDYTGKRSNASERGANSLLQHLESTDTLLEH